MLVFPHAKVNVGLRVLHKRPDGFHDISSVMLPIPLHDVLEAVVDMGMPDGEVSFVRTGSAVPGDTADDLCLKAVEAVREFRELPGLRIHLHKTIPAGAGLGGGSSDAAHMLLLLNKLLELRLAPTELDEMASGLGSDCTFFLHHGAQLAEGRGEKLLPITLDLRGNWMVLIAPGIHAPTPLAYAQCKPTGAKLDTKLLEQPTSKWQDLVLNDLEPAVFDRHPELAELKRALLNEGAAYASMSGSGSSVYGIFSKKPIPRNYPEGYQSWVLPL
ncbi:MAG: 4-(cytidine 5'-diphospho)-2-C-methyl-D-erythritol kinase [Flavobacteriales bacterium]|nr:4-(cytidine 5'-diphospho)-2-C-methyl-D-erythritol kinase [Flavobacteriales bacterium]